MVDRDLTLFGGIAVQSHRPPDADVVAVVRSGVERVVQASMKIDLTWHTFASTPADDLRAGRSNTSRSGLDWDFVAAKHAGATQLESISAAARSTAMKKAFDANPDYDLYDPHGDVADVAAKFPVAVGYRDHPVGGVTAAVQMSTWPLTGGGEPMAEATAALTGWLLDSADAVNADCGYVILGRLPRSGNMTSPYEAWTATHISDRDVSRYLWGYGWGTLLSAHHVEAVGGVSELEAVGTVTAVGGGRTWVTLGVDPRAVDLDVLARLRAVLGPVLRGYAPLSPDEEPGPDWYLPPAATRD